MTLNKPLNSGMGISIVAAKVTASNLPGGGILLYLQILMSNDIDGSPSLLTAQGAGQDHLGIYIKSIVEGGPAERVRLFKCEAGMWRVGMKQNGRLEISTIK